VIFLTIFGETNNMFDGTVTICYDV